MLRNSASGPEIRFPGRILAGFYSGKLQHRPSDRPSAGRRAEFGVHLRIRPKSAPEARFPARKHYCITWDSRCVQGRQIFGWFPRGSSHNDSKTKTPFPQQKVNKTKLDRYIPSRSRGTNNPFPLPLEFPPKGCSSPSPGSMRMIQNITHKNPVRRGSGGRDWAVKV